MAGQLLLAILMMAFVGDMATVCGQEYALGDECDLPVGGIGTCTKARDCPSLPLLLASGGRPKVCFYNQHVAVVCCPTGNGTTPANVAQPTSTKQPMPMQPTLMQPKPSLAQMKLPMRMEKISQTAPRPSAGKSGQKCTEYGREVYRGVDPMTLIFGSEKIVEADCSRAGQSLIVGGNMAAPKEFPHMAALGFGEQLDIVWRCGGSLISDKYILTAAHSLFLKGRGKVKWIQLGDLNMHSSTDVSSPQTFEVIETITYPEYKRSSRYHDIALLKLNQSVKFDAFVRPACLHTNSSTPPGVIATATGWGLLDANDDEMSKDLMKIGLVFYTAKRCNDTFRSLITTSNSFSKGFIEDTMICAGFWKIKHDTCVGDSGGPLQLSLPNCMYSIVGVTSFGNRGCGETSTPSVYTRVSYYVPWIESIVWP